MLPKEYRNRKTVYLLGSINKRTIFDLFEVEEGEGGEDTKWAKGSNSKKKYNWSGMRNETDEDDDLQIEFEITGGPDIYLRNLHRRRGDEIVTIKTNL